MIPAAPTPAFRLDIPQTSYYPDLAGALIGKQGLGWLFSKELPASDTSSP
jgi:hypothetical protein